jgi:hypothetical protein
VLQQFRHRMIRIFWRSWRLGSEDLDQRKHGFGRLALTRRRDQDWCHGLPVAVLGEVVVELRLELWEGVELLDVKRVHGVAQRGVLACNTGQLLKGPVGVGGLGGADDQVGVQTPSVPGDAALEGAGQARDQCGEGSRFADRRSA